MCLRDRSTTQDEWEDSSHRNIKETDKQCQNSAALRVIVDGVLQTTSNDMRRQKDETDVALARRIAETRDAKEKLEAHLAKVRQSRSELSGCAASHNFGGEEHGNFGG